MSQRYEVMVVVRPELGEAGVKEQIDRAERILNDQDAKEIRVHDWGQRDLAYRIDTCRRGWYYLIEYDGDAKAVNELERNLRLSDQILRFLTVRQEHEVRVPTQEASEPHAPSSSRGDAERPRSAVEPARAAAPAAETKPAESKPVEPKPVEQDKEEGDS